MTELLRSMKRPLGMGCALALATLLTPTARAGESDHGEAITKWLGSYDVALNAKDLDRLASFYHPEVTIFEGGSTNDAPATITRLIDLGVPRYLVAAHTAGVLAQRLVRALCPACRTRGRPPLAHALQLALPAETADDPAWWLPAGCPACRGAGYRGRISLFETLIPDRAAREQIGAGASGDAVRTAAARASLVSLLSDGLAKARAGLTTLEELGRVLEPDELVPSVCGTCGRVRPAGFPCCPFCGARAAGACPACGQRLLEAWSHCPACGAGRPP